MARRRAASSAWKRRSGDEFACVLPDPDSDPDRRAEEGVICNGDS